MKWSVLAVLLVLFGGFQFAYSTSTNDCDQNTGAPVHPMKAIRYCEYGSPDDVLKLEQVEKPVPNENQILVRVRAVSLRFFDGGVLEGGVGRLIFPKEKFVTFGVDFNTRDLGILRDLTESEKVVPALTKNYPLTETAAAYKYLETGHAQGKIAITME